MIEYRTICNNTTISIFLGGENGNIIFAPGLPQYIDKYHPLVQQIERLKYNLFVPHYPGTHDSGGELNIVGSANAIANTIQLVKKGYTNELFNDKKIAWKNTNFYALGFSFGALPLLIQKEPIDKIAVICPFVSMEFHKNQDYKSENISKTLDFLSRAYKNTYRFNKPKLLDELASTKLPKDDKNITVIFAEDDESIPFQEIQYLSQLYHCDIIKKPGTHSLKIDDEIFVKLWS